MNKSIIPLIFLCVSGIIILIFCDKQNYIEYQDHFTVLTNNAAEVEVFVKFNYDNIENVDLFVKDVARDIIIKYDHNDIINNYKDICYDIESDIIERLGFNNIKSPIIVSIIYIYNT